MIQGREKRYAAHSELCVRQAIELAYFFKPVKADGVT